MCRNVFVFVLQSFLIVGGVGSIEDMGENPSNFKTVRTSFSAVQIMPSTTSPSNDNKHTTQNPSQPRNLTLNPGHHHSMDKNDEHTDHHKCHNDSRSCRAIMRECTTRIIDRMLNGMEAGGQTYSGDFRCECVSICFPDPQQACQTLTRRINRRRKAHDDSDRDHSVLDHIGELIGTFGTGMVLGVFMALLAANLIKRRIGQRPETNKREIRSNSSSGLPAALRGPMPPPILSSEDLYTENPIGPPPKYDRVSSKGLYEDLDENESGGGRLVPHRPSSKGSGQNVYFVLEGETSNPEDEPEKDEDADNMPTENMRHQQVKNSNGNEDGAPKPQPRKPEKPPRKLKPDSEETKL